MLDTDCISFSTSISIKHTHREREQHSWNCCIDFEACLGEDIPELRLPLPHTQLFSNILKKKKKNLISSSNLRDKRKVPMPKETGANEETGDNGSQTLKKGRWSKTTFCRRCCCCCYLFVLSAQDRITRRDALREKKKKKWAKVVSLKKGWREITNELLFRFCFVNRRRRRRKGGIHLSTRWLAPKQSHHRGCGGKR